jgi:hypothetical protein
MLMRRPVGNARRRWVIVAIAVIGLAVAAAVAIFTTLPLTSGRLRERVVSTLEERLDSDVQLEGLSLRIFPRLHAEGTGLVVRHKRRSDVPPLITVQKFSIDADLIGIWRRRIAHLKLDGLIIRIPPGDDDNEQEGEKKDGPSEKSATADAAAQLNSAANTNESRVAPASDEKTSESSNSLARQVVVERLQAPDAELTILRRDPNKVPRTWYLHNLEMRTVGLQSGMPFDALLTNAVPPGQIATSGVFGPWNRSNPGITPINGKFTFDNANLGVFGGISGILSARGTYQGSLARIAVDGETETPDFMVTVSGHQLPLKTTYHALVDATNGNTTLDPVNATFLNTSLVAKGGVYELENRDGREVRLDVTMEEGHLEDIMRMAVKTPKPPMTGGLHLTTKLILPPGKIDVIEKLRLDGRFAIANGRFTDPEIQTKINQLSGLASGKKQAADTPGGESADKVTSDFTGRFRLGNGVLHLPLVTFDIPGAMVELNGQYAMRPETIDFTGNLFMDAKISETVSGWKSFLAKLADPLFRKNGKTVVPLKISGSRNSPQFGVDVKKALTRSTPDAPASRKLPLPPKPR